MSVEPTVNIAMGSTEPPTAPSGILHISIKELSDHTTKHWAKPLADLPYLCHQHASHQNAIAGGITQLSITHSLALHQPGQTGCVNPCVNGRQCRGRRPGAAGGPSKFVPEQNRSKVHVLVPL